MRYNSLTKDNILDLTDGKDLFNHYLKPFHNFGFLKPGQNISNPFLQTKQRTPSFNYFRSSNGSYRYYDFATGDTGSVFDLIMKLNGCTFKQCLEQINHQFILNLSA